MSNKRHITSTTVNFRDWVLGTGAFSDENLKKARDEFFAKLGKHWSEPMLASVKKAFSDHDAVPEARADLPDERPPNAVSANGGTLCAASRDGSGTGNTQEPSSPQWLDFNCNDRVRVKLTDHGREVLKHQHQLLNDISTYLPYRPPVEDSEGWSEWQLWRLMEAFGEKTGMGLPMCFHPVIQILADRVTNPTKPRNSALGEPVAWMGRAARIDGGHVTVLRLSRADAETDVHDAETCEPREIVPLYHLPQPTLTDEEREAVEWAIYEGPLRSQAEGAEERAATLRKLLDRMS